MFKFRLQKLLNFRQRLEEGAKLVYLERKAARMAGEKEIEEIREHRLSLSRSEASSVLLRLDLENGYAKSNDDEIAARIALGVLNDEEVAAEGAWIHAKRELQVIEKLRERAHDEWTLEDARKTQNALDEWAVLRRPGRA